MVCWYYHGGVTWASTPEETDLLVREAWAARNGGLGRLPKPSQLLCWEIVKIMYMMCEYYFLTRIVPVLDDDWLNRVRCCYKIQHKHTP